MDILLPQCFVCCIFLALVEDAEESHFVYLQTNST